MRSALVFCGVVLMGCQSSQLNPPLIFGQSHTVGISISGTTTTQGVDLTVGYKDLDIAVVPVTVSQPGGATTQLTAQSSAGFIDALSVLGQFDVNAGPTVQTGLGKFFATGLAAKVLADGFAAKMSK